MISGMDYATPEPEPVRRPQMTDPKTEARLAAFEKDLANVINKHSMDTVFEMHNFVLADMIIAFMGTVSHAILAEKRLKG